MRTHPLQTLLGLLGLSVLWLCRDAFTPAPPSAPTAPRKVKMAEVRVRSFGDEGARTIDLRGQRVEADESDTELELQPIEGVVRERDRESFRFRADSGQRRPTNAGELLDFTGAVRVTSSDGRRLASEKVLYYPRSGQIQSPGPATLVTSDSTIQGDRFETSTRLRSGLVSGHVVITSLRWAPAAATKTKASTSAAGGEAGRPESSSSGAASGPRSRGPAGGSARSGAAAPAKASRRREPARSPARSKPGTARGKRGRR